MYSNIRLFNQITDLSKSAIDSWVVNNNISNEFLKNCMISISKKLFFTANKRQDQVTEEYKNLQVSVKNNIIDLNKLVHGVR